MSELQIGKKKIGNGYPVYIIAEGCDNHMGDVEVAKEMCRQAKLAGADCIKFQHHLPDEEMLSDAVIAGKNNIPLYEFLKQHGNGGGQADGKLDPLSYQQYTIGVDGILQKDWYSISLYAI